MHIKSINSYDDFQTEINSKQNIIVNISATWCKPCIALKPYLEKYIKVINENDFIYLKIDHSIYETDDRFDMYFKMKKIPYFIFIENKKIKDSIISGDFTIVSKKIFNYIKNIKGKIHIDEEEFEKNDDF
jgi:thiol-disulfide isomerase/thioredoxin